MNLLITGASGYLGRHLLYALEDNKYNNIICIIKSYKIYKECEKLFSNKKIYYGLIEDKAFIEKIFNENKIHHVIHCAAIKYIDLCEKNMQTCISVNINGTLNLCEQARKYNVKKLITISTDKANNPTSFYGISKLAAEKITLNYNYSVYQGVNFWNSDGSFLQIWKTAISNNNSVILFNKNYIRYFSLPNETAKEILILLEKRENRIYYPNSCYKIKIIDIFNFLKNKYKNNKFVIKDEVNDSIKLIENINEKYCSSRYSL